MEKKKIENVVATILEKLKVVINDKLFADDKEVEKACLKIIYENAKMLEGEVAFFTNSKNGKFEVKAEWVKDRKLINSLIVEPSMKKIKEEKLHLTKLELLHALKFFGVKIKPVLTPHIYRVEFAFVRKNTRELVEIDQSFWDAVSDNGNASDIPSCAKTSNFHILNTVSKKLKTPLRCRYPAIGNCPAKKDDDMRVCLTCVRYTAEKELSK